MAVIPPVTRRYSSEFQAIQDGLKHFSTIPSSSLTKRTMRRFSSEFHEISSRTKLNRITANFQGRTEQYCMFNEYDKGYRSKVNNLTSTYRKDVSGTICYALETNSGEHHQKSLETYLDSLQRQAEIESSKVGSDIYELEDQNLQVEARKGLQSLERYIGILKEDAKSEECLPLTTDTNPSRMTKDSGVGYMNVTKPKRVYARKSKSSSLFVVEDSSHLYFMSLLISLNIAVFLFEIASPIKNSDSSLWSLPLMYGAKVNDLIRVGEWWRLVTPMFLHAGLLHIGLSSWALLSFGPQVCKGYGAFTFFLICILGGISGNFTSFLHTSEPTVGGSGPIFAVIGAWLIYQAQNKDVNEKENFESMFQKAIIVTGFSFILANFGPIDNWANLGAAISGIIYGYFTSPVVRIDDSSDKTDTGNRVKEEMILSREAANPCKSLIIFTLIMSALSSLLLFVESPLFSTVEIEELVQINKILQ